MPRDAHPDQAPGPQRLQALDAATAHENNGRYTELACHALRSNGGEPSPSVPSLTLVSYGPDDGHLMGANVAGRLEAILMLGPLALAKVMTSDQGLKMPEARVEALGDVACFALLGQASVGRIGITVEALPVILPVKFATHNGSVIFRSMPGTKLSAATVDSVVAFEVDSYESNGSSGWSVLVQGIASEVTDPEEVRVSLSILGTPWGVARPADRVVRIEVERISGRRFGTNPQQNPIWLG